MQHGKTERKANRIPGNLSKSNRKMIPISRSERKVKWYDSSKSLSLSKINLGNQTSLPDTSYLYNNGREQQEMQFYKRIKVHTWRRRRCSSCSSSCSCCRRSQTFQQQETHPFHFTYLHLTYMNLSQCVHLCCLLIKFRSHQTVLEKY